MSKKMSVVISDSDYEFIQKWMASEDDMDNDYNFDAPAVLFGICLEASFEDIKE